MQMVILLIGIVAILVGVVFNNRKLEALNKRYLKETFGKNRNDIDEQKSRIDFIKLHKKYDIEEHELVDDVTWNDLNMDDIFVKVNHTDSFVGEEYLYTTLHDLSKSCDELKKIEDKIVYFSENSEKRMNVRQEVYKLGKSSESYGCLKLIDNMVQYRLKNARYYYLLSSILCILAILSVISRDSMVIFIFIIFYIVNVFVHEKKKKEIKVHMVFTLGRIINTAWSINNIVPHFGKNIKIDNLKKKVRKSFLLEGSNIFKNSELHSYIVSYIMGPFMLDILAYNKIVSDFVQNKDSFIDVYKFVGEIDTVISIASYRQSIKNCSVPEITNKDMFSFKDIVHPCIENAISNSFFHDKNGIITGSNASGKSTFIKAIAINLILGQTIHTCTAKSAVIPKCGVVTSMAVRDDIATGESYYIREIRYLKRMIKLLESDRLLFLAVDEILKGTNTKERIAASKAILDYFNKKRCMLLVATHDLELARYFNDSYANYYFSEIIDKDDISFDYILNDGISNSSNAIKLLKVIGFPNSIIDNAKAEL